MKKVIEYERVIEFRIDAKMMIDHFPELGEISESGVISNIGELFGHKVDVRSFSEHYVFLNCRPLVSFDFLSKEMVFVLMVPKTEKKIISRMRLLI